VEADLVVESTAPETGNQHSVSVTILWVVAKARHNSPKFDCLLAGNSGSSEFEQLLPSVSVCGNVL